MEVMYFSDTSLDFHWATRSYIVKEDLKLKILVYKGKAIPAQAVEALRVARG
jgi:hypothetical protein